MGNCKHLCSGIPAVLLAAGLLVSCNIDEAYDLDKDIDMTMGLGAEGLALRLGNTEHIMLGDVLEIDDNELVDTDASHLYYLVKSDRSAIDVSVSGAIGHIGEVNVDAEHNVVDYEDVAGEALPGESGVRVEAGRRFDKPELGGSTPLEVQLTDLSPDINSLRAVYPERSVFDLRLELVSDNPALDFHFTSVRNFAVRFPSFIRVAGADAQGVMRFADLAGLAGDEVTVGQVVLDMVDFGEGPDGLGLDVVTDDEGRRFLTLADDVAMEGDFSIVAGSTQTMVPGDAVKMRLVVALQSGGRLDVGRITGEVNPSLQPDIPAVEIGDDLPDFLRDDRVTLQVKNPTLRFRFDATDLSVPVEFSGRLTAQDAAGAPLATAQLPAQGRSDVAPGLASVYYYSETGTPYDPAGVADGAYLETVPGLAALVQKIPQRIAVDCGEGRVCVKQGVLHDIMLGRTYSAAVDYEVLVPFEFNAGTTIVYTDSVTGMNEDLKDYQASGLELTADAVNLVPMALEVSVEPVDTEGRVIPEISVSTAQVAAASGLQPATTPVVLTLLASDPAAVSRLDRLRFRVTAVSEAEGELRSDQYFYFDNLRLRLKGQVVGDFN